MFTLTIDTAGAAFEDPHELSRILARATLDVKEAESRDLAVWSSGNLRDANGNTVGSWTYNPGPAPIRFQIVPDEDYDPATSVDWSDDETAAYVQRFEDGDLAPFGVIVERGDQHASLWGVSVATSTHTDGDHTYRRDAALDVIEVGEWYDAEYDEFGDLLALPTERSYLAEVLRELIAEVS